MEIPNTGLRNSQFLKPKRNHEFVDSLKGLHIKRRDNLITTKRGLEKQPSSSGRDEEIEKIEKRIKYRTDCIESLRNLKKYKSGKQQ